MTKPGRYTQIVRWDRVDSSQSEDLLARIKDLLDVESLIFVRHTTYLGSSQTEETLVLRDMQNHTIEISVRKES